MDSTIALLVFTNGRKDYLKDSLISLSEKIDYDSFRERWIVDDSGDPQFARWLDESFPTFNIDHHVSNMGFCRTINKAWGDLIQNSNAEYVFHIEDDFTYSETVDLQQMANILKDNPHLGQLALKRQPVNAIEQAAGDLIYKCGVNNFDQKDGWIEHDLFWTTNPSLYRREVMSQGWPVEARCEGLFTFKMRKAGFRFGYLGRLLDPPKIHHIGNYRTGSGY